MALYDERKWRQTKDTEQLTFEAGEDLAYSTYVRENPVGSHVVVETTQDLAIGYVISQKGAVQGDPVDVHMLRGLGSSNNGGSGTVVTDNGDGTYTANPNGGSGSVTWDVNSGGGSYLVSNIAFVDPVNGDDATGVVGEATLPFETIAGVYADASATQNTLVWIWSGTNEADSVAVTALKPQHWHVVNNATINFIGQTRLDANFRITGNGFFQCSAPMLVNNNPTTAIREVYVEGERAFGSTNTDFVDLTSIKGSFHIKEIQNLEVKCVGWTQAQFKYDRWSNSGDLDMYDISNFTDNGGSGYVSSNGFSHIWDEGHHVLTQVAGLTSPSILKVASSNDKFSKVFLRGTADLTQAHGITASAINVDCEMTVRTRCEDANIPFFNYTDTDLATSYLYDRSQIRCEGSLQSVGIILQGGVYQFQGRYTNQSTGEETFQFSNQQAQVSALNTTIFFGGKQYNFDNGACMRLDTFTNANHLYDIRFNDLVSANAGIVGTIVSGVQEVPVKVMGSFCTNKAIAGVVINTTKHGMYVDSGLSPIDEVAL